MVFRTGEINRSPIPSFLSRSRPPEVTNTGFADLANLVEAPATARSGSGESALAPRYGLPGTCDLRRRLSPNHNRFHVAFNLISRRYPAPPLTRGFCACALAVMSRSFADASSGRAWRVLKYSHRCSTTRTLSVPQSTRVVP